MAITGCSGCPRREPQEAQAFGLLRRSIAPTSSPGGSARSRGLGLIPMQFDISLKRGVWITGKVTDAATGKAVSAAVDYFPMLTNAHAPD